ncbi:hypothetical protein KKG31_00695 [Patescibacteria group bacterium]|nr:hypothetical protein [Patescibacteria group bacterium]MBU1757703.1 hypothetical protein [Patescibacteria group bacterium]
MEKLRISSESGRNINKLIDKINSTCNDLLDTLTLKPDAVGNYGVIISQKLDTEFVDRIVRNIWILKAHLKDLKANMDEELSDERVENIANGLLETSDQLNQFVSSNGFFHNSFGWAIEEVNTMISKILDRLPIGVYKFAA